MGLFGDSFEGITLTHDVIKYKRDGGPVAGAVARVESGADVRRRVTAARFIMLSPLIAFAAKKQVGHVFLTVEGDGFEFAVEVPVKKESDARKFAAKINNASKHKNGLVAEAAPRPGVEAPAPLLPAAAWYPDPSNPAILRWWDGLRWTEHTAPTN